VSAWYWLGWAPSGVLVLLWFVDWRRSRAQRALILSLLERRGEMTGPELKASGVSGRPYLTLRALEEEGLVESRSDGIAHPERGGLPRRYYKLAKKPAWVAK
jgi:DNA-binding PadR family transcriptional regulator